VLLYIGRLIRRKGITELLSAWTNLPHTCVGPASLLLVGDGPDMQQYVDYCANHRLSNVRFAGRVEYDRLPLYYAAADAFVIPTLEDNWSLVVPEAMACGLPILCSKYNGCWPELVREGINGWVFDPLDVNSTTAVLTQAIQNCDRLETMGRVSRQIVSAHNAVTAAQAVLDACNRARGEQ
jgi:glycosyltransferase involved in cell wall biosynthesis